MLAIVDTENLGCDGPDGKYLFPPEAAYSLSVLFLDEAGKKQF